MGIDPGGGHSIFKEQRERTGRPGCDILCVLARQVKGAPEGTQALRHGAEPERRGSEFERSDLRLGLIGDCPRVSPVIRKARLFTDALTTIKAHARTFTLWTGSLLSLLIAGGFGEPVSVGRVDPRRPNPVG